MRHVQRKGYLLNTLMVTLLFWAVAGCSRNGDAKKQDNEEYQAMLARVHARNAKERADRDIHKAIEQFQHDLGRLPGNLRELVQLGYLEEIPALPENMGYFYDPVLGRVQIAPRSKQR